MTGPRVAEYSARDDYKFLIESIGERRQLFHSDDNNADTIRNRDALRRADLHARVEHIAKVQDRVNRSIACPFREMVGRVFRFDCELAPLQHLFGGVSMGRCSHQAERRECK